MHAIKLGNTEFEGRNNAYLLAGEAGVALVDTGVSTAEIREQLRSGLSNHGYTFADVDDIVLTHWHPDHTGLAGALQAASGATVHVHAADAPLIRQDPDAWSTMRRAQHAKFEAWGMPAEKHAELEGRLDRGEALAGDPAEVVELADGDQIDVGNRRLTVFHAPGHAAGLCCFEFEIDGGLEAFVGDAVLPVYTPNVGGADVRVDRPLARYLETLDRMVARDYVRIWPGHRDVIESPTERAREIADHHRERTERIVSVLEEHGPMDAWTVSAHLFGDLHGVHIMHGPGEAYAHLDHLAHHGVVADGPDGYALTTDAEARLAALW